MNPCPYCNEPVLEMAQKCRHCGQELDEATIFMNESAMLEEVQAIKKQAEELQLQKVSLKKQFQLSAVMALLFLLAGGGFLVFTSEVLLQGIGASLIALGVLAGFVSLKARRAFEAL